MYFIELKKMSFWGLREGMNVALGIELMVLCLLGKQPSHLNHAEPSGLYSPWY
jgi:hypothetical protein